MCHVASHVSVGFEVSVGIGQLPVHHLPPYVGTPTFPACPLCLTHKRSIEGSVMAEHLTNGARHCTQTPSM